MGKIRHHVFQEPSQAFARQEIIHFDISSTGISNRNIQKTGKGTGENDKYAYPNEKPEWVWQLVTCIFNPAKYSLGLGKAIRCFLIHLL